MIRRDIKRLFKTPLFYVFLLVALFALFVGMIPTLQTVNQLRESLSSAPSDQNLEAVREILEKVSGYDFFRNALHDTTASYFVVVIPLFAGVLFSGQFTYDKTSGFGSMLITRSGFSAYFRKRAAFVALLPFLVLFLLLIAYLLFCLIFFSAQAPQGLRIEYNSIFDNFYYRQPLLYSIFVSLHFGLYASFYSLIGFCMANFTNNRFLVSVSPIFVYLCLMIVPQALNIEPLSWVFVETFTYFFTGNPLAKQLSIGLNYLILLFLYAIPIAGMLSMLYYKNKKNYLR